MYEKTKHDGPGSHLVASLTIELLVLAYELKADCRDEFKRFYDTEIRAWLAKNYVAHADSWIVGNYLIVVSSSPMRPWSTIPGLDRYVEKLEPVPAHALPKYLLSSHSSAASYAAD
jgi:hypothetical protein